jgi:hypothetical protein
MADQPEINPEEIKLAPEAGAPVKSEEEAAQDALETIADNLSLIQRHLFALLYMAHTWRPEVTGVTYVHEVFQAIYTEADPFKEVDDLLGKLQEEAAKKPDKKNARK